MLADGDVPMYFWPVLLPSFLVLWLPFCCFAYICFFTSLPASECVGWHAVVSAHLLLHFSCIKRLRVSWHPVVAALLASVLLR